MMLNVFSHLGTTSIIFVLSCFFSLAAVVLTYEVLIWGRRGIISQESESAASRGSELNGPLNFLLFPAIILAPILIWIFYRVFGTSLIFPPELLASNVEIIVYCILPSFVLLIGAGFFLSVFKTTKSEITYWSSKPFATVALAMGKDIHRELRPLVITRAFVDLWGKVLPWYFGELIVVESLFNAPGLGLYLWDSTIRRDFKGALSSAAIILVLYAAAGVANNTLAKWIGRRLESYG